MKISEKSSLISYYLETNSVCRSHADEMCCACFYTIHFI